MHIIIVGCGRVGSELAKLLSSEGHNVVVVDRKQSAFDRLGNSFNGVTVAGNGFDLDLLKHAGIEKAEAFCAVTNGDNTNLISAQVAKKIFNVPKVLARVYDPQRAYIYTDLGLDIISGTKLFASMIRDKIIESRFSSYLIESKYLAVLEVPVDEKLAGKSIKDINIDGEFLVAAIRRAEAVVIPGLNTVLRQKDILMGIVKIANLANIKDKFGLQ